MGRAGVQPIAAVDDVEPRRRPSLSEIARLASISRPHASRIMSGARLPSLNVAARMARVHGMTLDQFYRYLVKIHRHNLDAEEAAS